MFHYTLKFIPILKNGETRIIRGFLPMLWSMEYFQKNIVYSSGQILGTAWLIFIASIF